MIKNRCASCDEVIEAPDDQAGREAVCPGCGAANVLRRPGRAAGERARFLDGLARASRGARPDAADDVTLPIEQGEPPRGLGLQTGQRLKDISLYLLGFAYLFLLLSIVLAGILALGTGLGLAWKAFALLASALVGVFLFIVLKFMSDGMRALADASELLRSVEHRLAVLAEDRMGYGVASESAVGEAVEEPARAESAGG